MLPVLAARARGAAVVVLMADTLEKHVLHLGRRRQRREITFSTKRLEKGAQSFDGECFAYRFHAERPALGQHIA